MKEYLIELVDPRYGSNIFKLKPIFTILSVIYSRV